MKQRKNYRLLLALISIFCFCSCKNFYLAKSITVDDRTANQLDSLKNAGRYFILRSGHNSVHMSQPALTEDRSTLLFTPNLLVPEHKLYIEDGPTGNRRYKKNHPFESNVLNEVHIYSDSISVVGSGLPINQIQKIEVIQYDKRRSAVSHFVGGMAGGLLALLGVMTVALASSDWSIY